MRNNMLLYHIINLLLIIIRQFLITLFKKKKNQHYYPILVYLFLYVHLILIWKRTKSLQIYSLPFVLHIKKPWYQAKSITHFIFFWHHPFFFRIKPSTFPLFYPWVQYHHIHHLNLHLLLLLLRFHFVRFSLLHLHYHRHLHHNKPNLIY